MQLCHDAVRSTRRVFEDVVGDKGAPLLLLYLTDVGATTKGIVTTVQRA